MNASSNPKVKFLNNLKTGEFALLKEPVSFQLTVHFNNLIECAKDTYFKDDIINLLNILCEDPAWLNECYTKHMRDTDFVKFRAAHLINHYGIKTIQNHIKLVYQKKSVG